MAKRNIAASQLSSNDISCLAKIFETVFLFYCDHYSPSMNDFLKGVSVIVGLGLTAVLMDKTFVRMYQERLGTFIRYSDLRKPEGNIPLLSLAVAEMIELACKVFSYEKCPSYLSDCFGDSLEKVLQNINIQVSDYEPDAKRLLKTILKAMRYF